MAMADDDDHDENGDVTPPYHQTFVFNGRTESTFVRSPALPSPDIAELTICVWFRTRPQAGNFLGGHLYFYHTGDHPDQTRIALYQNSYGKLEFKVMDSVAGYSDPLILGSSAMHHLCATWKSSSGIVRLYLDGTLRFTRTDFAKGQLIPHTNNSGIIGAKRISFEGPVTSVFLGEITGFDMWRAELAPEVIDTLSRGPGRDRGDLINMAKLLSSHMSGNISLLPSPKSPVSAVEDVDFLLRYKPSTTGACAKTIRGFEDISSFTISVWFTTSIDNFTKTLFSYRTADQADVLRVDLRKQGVSPNLIIVVDIFYLSELFTHTSTSLTSGWYHLALEKTTSRVKSYMNGINLAVDEVSHLGPVSFPGRLVIGQKQETFNLTDDWTQPFLGDITRFEWWSRLVDDEVVWVKKALSQWCGPMGSGDLFGWNEARGFMAGSSSPEPVKPSRCAAPRVLANQKADSYCEKNCIVNAASPRRALFDQLIGDTTRQWRCYGAASVKAINEKYGYQADTLSSKGTCIPGHAMWQSTEP
ncbi:uncharacterized protein LOC116620201 [Nematostella vectensis]|uniref:uncharacterized protein LOC116620201 n=1 Tax=Nematostella vectensis TaxID=45351 RepID=UPI0020778F06|nr:uncharacterized protein LOC116620201 [Nematostella vectensis]